MHSIPRRRTSRKPASRPRADTFWQFLDRLFTDRVRYSRLIMLIVLLSNLDLTHGLAELLRHTAAMH